MVELTPKQALLKCVQAALSSYILNTPSLADRKSYIPLQLSKQRSIVYVCPIAFKLSKLVNAPKDIDVARSISQLIIQKNHQQNLIVQVVEPGWIYLELSQPSLAAWLQHWIETLPCLESREERSEGVKRAEALREKLPLAFHQFPIPNSQFPTSNSLFPIQYAHARCCSLLHMAHREKIIAIASRNPDINFPCLAVISPQPLPWLSEARICLNHPAELDLLIQLITVLDDLFCPSPTDRPIDWLKTALHLSQAFQTFYSQCRIWGEVKNRSFNLAQARLGLVAIAQSAFRILLVEILDSFAPSEL